MTTIPDEALKHVERLRWQCRRGMLELDVLLEAFLVQGYPSLEPRLQRQFIRLLELPDPIIHAWCVGGEIPEDQAYAELTALIHKTRLT